MISCAHRKVREENQPHKAALLLPHVHSGVYMPYSLIMIFARKEYRSETMHKAFLSV